MDTILVRGLLASLGANFAGLWSKKPLASRLMDGALCSRDKQPIFIKLENLPTVSAMNAPDAGLEGALAADAGSSSRHIDFPIFLWQLLAHTGLSVNSLRLRWRKKLPSPTANATFQ
jgi:hypothetical protein